MLAMTTSRRTWRLTSPKAHEVSPLESAQQIAVMQWAALASGQWPQLRLLQASANGGKRDAKTASHLKRQGVKPGYPDLALHVARDGYFGLFIELKRWPNKPTDLQAEWHEALRAEGHRVEVCYSATAAIEVLRAYMQAAPTRLAA